MARQHSKFKRHHSCLPKQAGFVFVELLVTLVLTSAAGMVLIPTFVGSLKAYERVQANYRAEDPMRFLYWRLEKDLRNVVSLRDFPFEGKKDSIEFPTLRAVQAENGEIEKKLYLVKYEIKADTLIRVQKELRIGLKESEAKEKILLRGLEKMTFLFPYKQPKHGFTFEDFWLGEPYEGIPIAVKIVTEHQSKMVSIPQGRWGRAAKK